MSPQEQEIHLKAAAIDRINQAFTTFVQAVMQENINQNYKHQFAQCLDNARLWASEGVRAAQYAVQPYTPPAPPAPIVPPAITPPKRKRPSRSKPKPKRRRR